MASVRSHSTLGRGKEEKKEMPGSSKEKKRPGGASLRWDDNIRMDIKEIGFNSRN